MKKYFLHLIFTFYLNTDASVIKFSLSLYFNKKQRSSMRSVLTHLLRIETVSELLDCGRQKEPKLRSYRYILMKTRTHIMTINQYYCRKTSNFGRILEKLIPNSRSYTAITSCRASKFDFFSCSLHCGYFFRSWMCFRVSHICSKILINSLTGTKLGWFRCLPPFIS